MVKYSQEMYDAVLGEPKAVFKKTITGKVVVQVLDPFDVRNKTVLHVILQGDDKSPTSKVKLYSDEEYKYFVIANRRLLEEGIVVPVEGYEEEEVEIKYYTDEEIEEYLKDRYFKRFKKFIDEYVTSPERLARVLNIAKNMDISKSKIDLLRAKAMELGISEVEL